MAGLSGIDSRRQLPRLLVLWALAGTLSALPATDVPWKLDPAMVTSMETTAHCFARSGMRAELHEFLGTLGGLGYPGDKSAKLAKACDAELARGKRTAALTSEAIRRIGAASQQLSAILPTLAGDSKADLARSILRLDSSVDAAHVAVGHEKSGDEWITSDEKQCRVRRAEIVTRVQQARRLEVEIDSGESQHSFLVSLLGHPGTQSTWKNVTLHTGWGEEKTARVLREVVRGMALSNFLRTGKFAPDELGKKEEWVLVDSKLTYAKAIDLALEQKGLSAPEADNARKMSGFFDKRKFQVDWSRMEGEQMSALLTFLTWNQDGAASCLIAGHLNWVSMEYFGAHLPGWAWTETKGPGSGRPAGETRVADAEDIERTREEYLRLSQAGIAGCRAYMSFLAERGEDPPWSSSMLDQIGRITGENLLKSTSVIEFLQELRPLQPLISATNVLLEKNPEAIFEKALGEPVSVFESRWRRWVVPTRPSLLQRLEGERERASRKPGARSDSTQEVLAVLNSIRASAFKNRLEGIADVSMEPSLSLGARNHALYLNENPEQKEEWPAAHEEYADRKGFTPEGALAGSHSVIHPGAKGAKDAIDGWMGTFYHRLPLIDPGLRRIGWANENQCAVLDSGSLCAPAESCFDVVWPFDGMASVPTRFCPELPNPVPGEDQETFGYPITLQMGMTLEGEDGSAISMQLFDGKVEVPCHLSSPNNPTNPELAPPNSYCLIPKTPLKAKTKYTVSATWKSTGRTLSWSFHT